jgi:hypothetical protein
MRYRSSVDEDHALHIGLVVIGAPPLAIALASGSVLGPGPTAASLLLVLGLVGLVRGAGRDGRVLPRARWRKRRP